MNEKEYIESIDACFPYENEGEWKAIIDEGICISDNCAYMALYEICCGYQNIPKSNLLSMLEYWALKYSHPIKNILLEVATAFIKGTKLPEDKALKYLDIIANYPGFYNAANIVSIAGPENSKRIKQKHDEIVSKWKP